MDIKEIKQIVELMKKSDLTEFAVEEENFKLQIKRATGAPAPTHANTFAPPPVSVHAQPMTPTAPASSGAPAPAAEDKSTYITSPMVGTFYGAPSPDSPAFVKVGDPVQPDSVVCIIEAMKIMNEIQSELKGTIAEILVENGQPVEFGQRLYRLV